MFLNREIRRRTRIAGTFPDSNSALMLACARLRHVADTQWGNKGNFLLCQHPADGRGGTDIGDKQLVDLGDYVQQNGGGDSWSVQQAILLTTSDGDDSIT